MHFSRCLFSQPVVDQPLWRKPLLAGDLADLLKKIAVHRDFVDLLFEINFALYVLEILFVVTAIVRVPELSGVLQVAEVLR